MKDYRERISKTAIRYSGQPVTLSPQLYSDLTIQRVAGHEVDFRVVLFVGDIDPTEVTITFPQDSIVKVHVKHDVKAIDEESCSIRRQKVGDRGPRTTTAIVCSRDCATYYKLPEGVQKGNLTAQLTQDKFLIIQSRKDRSSVCAGFDVKRLVPVDGCLKLDPHLSPYDFLSNVQELMETAFKLWQRVKEFARQVEVQDLHGPIKFDPQPGVDSSRSGSELSSTTQSEAAGRDIGSTSTGDTAEETNRKLPRSAKSSSKEIGKKETDSTVQSEPVKDTNGKGADSRAEEAAEREAGSTVHSEAARINVGITVKSDSAEETTKRRTRSAKSASEETGKKEQDSTTQSETVKDESKKDTGSPSQSGKDFGSCAREEVTKESTKRSTRSTKLIAEDSCKKENGSASLLEANVETKNRSAESAALEPTVEKEIDSEAPMKRVTRSSSKTDLKLIAGKDCSETDPGSESVEESKQETASSDSKAEEKGSKPSETPRRGRSKERPKESSAVSKLKEESKRRKSVV